MTTSVALQGFYDYRLVVLSIFIAIVAAYAALDLVGRVTTAYGKAQIVWLTCGSVAMGLGIWAMHYIGMEAFQLPIPVEYDWPTVLLSLLAAILASCVALFVASRATMSIFRTALGSLFMGGGIAAMHYIGMEAMRLSAMCVYSPELVTLSVILAVAISYIALRLTFSFRATRPFWDWRKAGSGLAMGLAIPVMHYVGMAAVHFMPTSSISGSLAHAISVSNLGLASIAMTTLTVLTIVFVSSTMDRHLAAQARQFAQSRLQLQTAFDNMTESIVVIDCDENIVLLNRAASGLLGVPYQSKFSGKLVQSFDFMLPNGDLLPSEQWPRNRALRGEVVKNYEIGIRIKNTGNTVTVEINTAVITDEVGHIVEAIISYRDVSERKQADRQLAAQAQQFAESSLQLQTVFDHMKEAIVVVDRERNIIQRNRAAKQLLGLRDGVNTRKDIAEGFELSFPDGMPLPPEQWPTIRALHGEYLDGQEIIIRRNDTGKTAVAEISTTPISNGTGEVTQIILSYRDVSERKLMDEARIQLDVQSQRFVEGRLQLQSVFDNMTEAIIVIDYARNIIEHNRAAVKFLGLRSSAASLESIAEDYEAFSPTGVLLRQEEWPISRALRGDFCRNVEVTMRRRDSGATVITEISTVPIPALDGNTHQIIASFTDISERKQMEEAQAHIVMQERQLTESRLQLQTVFDHMTEAVVVLDQGRNITHLNRAASDLLGIEASTLAYPQIEATFESFSSDGSLLTPGEWPSARALRGELHPNLEVEIRRKDTGKSVLTEIHTVAITNAAGDIAQIIITLRDISERKQMDEARARLVSIVEFSEDAIIGKSDKGIVTSWNRGAEKVFGYTAQEMIGRSVRVLLPPGHEQEEEEILARIKGGEIVKHIESMRKKKDGTLINVSLTISPIRDATGKVIGASKIARDITEKKQLERQLHQSQKMEAVGQLTGGIAHDFNNLLGVVIGNLDLLEGMVPGNEVALKRVRTAQKGAMRGADLTRRLLAFSSNEELRPSVVKLQHSIGNMIELAARAIGPEIKITTHFDDSLPPVFVDAAGMESALLNLVVNARDAMPKGGSINITTQLHNLEESYSGVKAGELKTGSYACVSVSDTGAGMSRETIERAFEPFFTTKPRGKGTGLGLAMVYGFVKQSGGTIRIYSELGYGTTISFYLPLAEGMALPVTTPTIALPAKRRGTVLVVDDELDLLDIAFAYLAELGCNALQAKDGASALEVIGQHTDIGLMVTDIIMPGGMNGVELAQKVRQLRPEIKIIYCSGFPADALAERSMPLVDGPLLHKPYQRADFSAMVRRVMEGSTANLQTK